MREPSSPHVARRSFARLTCHLTRGELHAGKARPDPPIPPSTMLERRSRPPAGPRARLVRTRVARALLAAASCAGPPAFAQDGADGANEARRLATGDDFGDFSGRDLDEGGMATQVVREAFTASGIDTEMSFEPWKEGYDETLAGNRDGAFPWYFLPERTEDFVYTDSIYELVERIFHLDGDPDVPEIRGAADLAGLNLCYPVGWGLPPSIQAMMDSGETVRTEPGDMSRCFDLLANGRVDAVLSPQLQGYATVEAHPELDAFDVATASWEVTIRTLSVLLPKAAGRARACGDAVRFGAGLATVRANGLFDVIARRWFGPLAQLASPSETYELVRRAPDGATETLSGTAIGLSGGSFLVDAGEAGVRRVPLDELAWIGRAGFDQLDVSRAWCLGEAVDAEVATSGVAEADGTAAPASAAGSGDDAGADDDADAGAEDVAGAADVDATEAATDAGTGVAGERTLKVAGPGAFTGALVPDLLAGWVERRVTAAGDGAGFAVVDASNDPREPDRLEIAGRSTADAFEALADGRAELAVADRPPLPAERAALAPLDDFPSEATEHVFALEAIVPVVHASRALEAIGLEGLRAAVAGSPPDWTALGEARGNPDANGAANDAANGDANGGGDAGGGRPSVHVSDRLAASLGRGGPGDAGGAAGLPAVGPTVVRHPNRAAVLAAVAADPDALGLVAHLDADPADGYAARGVRALGVADCELVHPPTGFAARSEEYPLSRRLYLYYSPRRADFAGGFVRHAQSDAGQRTVAAHGLVDLSIVGASDEDRAGALANRARTGVQSTDVAAGLDAAVADARRLSTTFRFVTGSARLDARAVRDAERLAGWLRERDLDASDVRLVGYADSRGGYPRNCELSRQRAGSVAEALAGEGLDGTATAFGACEEAPVACNATAVGQELNRRVEVWLRDGATAALR